MTLREYLETTNTTMAAFGKKIGRAQSIVSRLCAKKHRPDPSSAIRIVAATKGRVTLNDLYDLPKKWRTDTDRAWP